MSRTNFISSHTSRAVRVVGLSTALANARDLADWLGIGQVRPVCLSKQMQMQTFGLFESHFLKNIETKQTKNCPQRLGQIKIQLYDPLWCCDSPVEKRCLKQPFF